MKLFARDESSARQYGVVLDGTTAHGVVIEASIVVDRRSVGGTSAYDALSAWWTEVRPKGSVRVAWGAEPLGMATVSLPPLPPEVRRVALEAAGAEHLAFGADNVAVAGILLDPELGTSAVAVVLDTNDLRELWESPMAANVDLTASALVPSADGVWLLAGENITEIVLVQRGTPLASRHIGGVETLAECARRLGEDTTGQLLAAARMGDNDAVSVIDGWCREVASELRRTLDYWTRQGHNVGHEITVVGAGALATPLPARLSEIGAAATLAEPPFGPAEGWQSRGDASCWALPVVLATSPIDDLSIFSNPAWQQARHQREEKVAQQAKLVRVGAVAAAALLVLAVPVVLGKREASAEKKQLAAVQGRLAANAPDLALANSVELSTSTIQSTVEAEPDWTYLTLTLLETKPATIGLEQVTMRPDGTGGLRIEINGSGVGSVYADVVQWVDDFEAKVGVLDIYIPAVTSSGTTSEFQAQFRLPSPGEIDEFTGTRSGSDNTADSTSTDTETEEG